LFLMPIGIRELKGIPLHDKFQCLKYISWCAWLDVIECFCIDVTVNCYCITSEQKGCSGEAHSSLLKLYFLTKSNELLM